MTTTYGTWLDDLQAVITNRLDLDSLRGRRVAGILGDVPSTYAKSPRLWNAAFQALNLEASYVPLDVARKERLPDLLKVLRASDGYLGGSVTVPYKVEIVPLLDEVDPLAARIGAVNTIARTADGRLIGYNTDGLGGVRALTDGVLPDGSARPQDLSRLRILLLGAGGAAQALAFTLWERMTDGELLVSNRTLESADRLVARLQTARRGAVSALPEDAIADRSQAVDLIINATVKGQAGIRTLPDGRRTFLEPYSSLASAQPVALPAEQADDARAFLEAWSRASMPGVARNHAQSLERCARLPQHVLCYDIIYSPLETTFLRHARWSGHATLNGRAMNVAQAVEAFMRYTCRAWLGELGMETPEVHRRVAQAMASEWVR